MSEWELLNCNYPDCGCDYDEICGQEVARRAASIPNWQKALGIAGLTGVGFCLIGLILCLFGALYAVGGIIVTAISRG